MIGIGLRNIDEIRSHYIYVDFWEYFLGEYISTPLVAAIANTRVTPNQITLIGIGLNILAGILFSNGAYFYLVIGAVLCQVSFVMDFADGQLARYKNMSSAKGEWLDILGDAFSDCVIFAGLGYGYYSNTGEVAALYITIFGCSIYPLYYLHRQVRNRLIGNDKRLNVAEAQEKPITGLAAFVQKAEFWSINRKLLISLGIIANLVKITMILVIILVFVKYLTSIILFLSPGTKSPKNG